MPTLNASPDPAVVDEEIEITASGLEPNSPITISADIVYYKILYLGFGHFYSNCDGRVNTKVDCSHGGTYLGIQAMGLFTSMKPMPSKHSCPRLVVKVSVEKPLTFNLNIWKGHLPDDEVHQLLVKSSVLGTKYPSTIFFTNRFLCSRPIQRTYLSDNVSRNPFKVNYDGETICGVLFLPKAQGSFCGVIDVFGAAGGIIETRAALLAKHGFAAMALGYFGMDGVKALSPDDLNLSFFNKVINWFAMHASVKPGGVGMIGMSLGSQIVLLNSINNANVKAAICVNSNLLMITEEKTKIPTFDDFLSPCFRKERELENLYEMWNGQIMPNINVHAQISRPKLQYPHDNAILFLMGEHDVAKQCVDDVFDQLIKSGKRKVFKRVIEGEGHLIDPPYMPIGIWTSGLWRSAGSKFDDYEQLYYDAVLFWGGDREKHAKGQADAWNTVIEFFKQHLNTVESKL